MIAARPRPSSPAAPGSPAPPRFRLPPVLLSLLLMAAGGGCDAPRRHPVTLLDSPVPVVAVPSEGEQDNIYHLEVRSPERTHTVRTALRERPGGGDPEAELRRLVAWRAPYLFVREDNGGGNASRADVDHVFKLGGERLQKVGTVSAREGEPGSQWQDGRFLDVYDRLEFTPLTAHAGAPQVPLVMVEREGRFEVLLEETWKRAGPGFEEDLAELEARAKDPGAAPDGGYLPNRRGVVLRCLTVTRYCRRAAEYERCLELSRKVLEPDDLREVLAEVETVRPGELAPSFEEVFRIHPALLNVFAETPAEDSEPAPQPGITAPPAPDAPTRGLLDR